MSKFTILETPIGHLEGEFNNNSLLLHLDYTGGKFNKKIYIEMLEIFEDVVDGLSAKGIEEVFSLIDKKQEKVCKWQDMFGLNPFLEFQDHTLYRRTL